MMNKLTRRLFSFALAAALTAGLCLPACLCLWEFQIPQRLLEAS